MRTYPASSRAARKERIRKRKKLIAWFTGGVLALLSALGAAFTKQITEVFSTEIQPAVAEVTCAASEAFHGNSAPNRFTVVLLPFENDPGDAIRTAMRDDLARQLGLNVITSCTPVKVAAEGDYPQNLERAKHKLRGVFKKFNANMVLMGTIKRDASGHPTDRSTIGAFEPKWVQYFNDNGGSTSETFDPISVGTFDGGPEMMKYLIETAEDMGASSGCFAPIFAACNDTTPPLTTKDLTELAKRIHQIQVLYLNKGFSHQPALNLSNYFQRSGMTLAAIFTELYVNRGVTKIDLDGETGDTLHAADMELAYITSDDETKTPSGLLRNQASVNLRMGLQCDNPSMISTASAAFNIPHLKQTLSDNPSLAQQQPVWDAILFIEAAEAELGIYALGDTENDKANKEAFDTAAKEALASVESNRRFFFMNEFTSNEDATLRNKLLKRIATESELLRRGLDTQTKGQARQLLAPVNCK